MKNSAIISVFCFIFGFSFSQGEYKWEEGLSVNIGTFDTQKYSNQQIDLIYDYLINHPNGMFEAGHVWNIQQMNDSTKVLELDSVYLQTKEIYNTIQLPAGEFWSQLLMQRKTELNELYNAKKQFLLSFYNPDLLLDKSFPDCFGTVKSLTGTEEEILAAWKVLVDEQKKNNCCPDEVEKKYLAELSSEYQLLYARMELSNYSWWNCRNKYIHYVNDEKGMINKEFMALFLSVRVIHMED